MLFTSPHPTLFLPPEDTSLPSFLLRPSTSGNARAGKPLLYPVAPGTAFSSTRPQAKPLSLDEIREVAYKIAQWIHNGGLNGELVKFQKGDVVAVYSSNQHDYLALVLGVHLAGGVLALCNPSYKPTELAHQLRMTKARAVVTTMGVAGSNEEDTPFVKAKKAIRLASSEQDDEAAGGFKKLPEEPSLFLFEEESERSWRILSQRVRLSDEARARVEERSKQIHGSHPAVFCFSSGTSGLPKAVMLSHTNLISNVVQATFLLHDRMNEPLLDGKIYSKDGTVGWYDEAQARGSGRVETQTIDDQASGEQGAKEIASLTSKMSSMTQSFKSNLGIKGDETSRKSTSAPNAEEEFHIDVLPQFHCYGLLVNLVALHTCTPRVIMPRFHLESFLQNVAKYRVTFCFVVPPILLALAKHPLVDDYDISSLWRVASGAASLPEEIASAVGKRLGLRCTDGYGMTEMSPIISMQTVGDIRIAPGTVGVLAPSTQALVVDPDGKELGADQAGELLIRGPQMMQGYFENEEANKAAFVKWTGDGGEKSEWLRTGDMVKIDQRGYITITDRLKDVIKAKGFQVSPAELEAILFKDSRVADVAVTGVRDAKDGAEIPWAFIVAHDSVFATQKGRGEKELEDYKLQVAKEILQKANSQMAGYKKIAGSTWLDALPKSDSGKMLKKDLKAT